MTGKEGNEIIHVDIVHKDGARWSIIGHCPESVAPSGGLHVSRGKDALVRCSTTDAVITTGNSLRDVLQKLADQTGLTVELTDEYTEKVTNFDPAARSVAPEQTPEQTPERKDPMSVAKRGDLVAVRTTPRISVQSGTGYDTVSIQLYTVTSINRVGEPTAVRSVAYGESPILKVKNMQPCTLAVVPAARFHIEDAVYEIMRTRADRETGYLPAYDSARELLKDLEPWHAADPAVLAEVRAWADTEALAEVRANECTCPATGTACEKPWCNGVPEHVELSADDAAEADDLMIPALQAAVREALGVDEVSLPTGRYSDWRRARHVERYTWQAVGYEFSVIFYPATTLTCRDTLQHAALYIDGVRVLAGLAAYGKPTDGIARVIAYELYTRLQLTGWRFGQTTPGRMDTPARDDTPEHTTESDHGKDDHMTEVSTGAPVTCAVERDALADALAYVGKAASSGKSLPVLGGVVITVEDGKVTLGGFDYEQSRTVTLAARACTPGRVLVSCHTLAQMVKELGKGKDDVILTDVAGKLEIAYGTTRMSIPTMPVEDYPALPELAPVIGQVNPVALSSILSRIVYAVGTDEILPMLMGVRMVPSADMLSFAATDRYRLTVGEIAWVRTDDNATSEILIFGKVFAEVAKVFAKHGGTITVGHTSGHMIGMVSLTCGPYTFTVRTLDGPYPPVQALFAPDYPATGEVGVAELIGAVKRVTAGLDKKAPVRLTWSPVAGGDGVGEVTVSSGGTTTASASETLTCLYNGAAGFTVVLDPGYLIDGMKAIDTKRALFGFTHSHKPCVITPVAGITNGFRYLIMPMCPEKEKGVSAAKDDVPTPARDNVDADTTTTQPDSSEDNTMTSANDKITAKRLCDDGTGMIAVLITDDPKGGPVSDTANADSVWYPAQRKTNVVAAVVTGWTTVAPQGSVRQQRYAITTNRGTVTPVFGSQTFRLAPTTDDLEKLAEQAHRAAAQGDTAGALELITAGQKADPNYQPVAAGMRTWPQMRALVEARAKASAGEPTPVEAPEPAVTPDSEPTDVPASEPASEPTPAATADGVESDTGRLPYPRRGEDARDVRHLIETSVWQGSALCVGDNAIGMLRRDEFAAVKAVMAQLGGVYQPAPVSGFTFANGNGPANVFAWFENPAVVDSAPAAPVVPVAAAPVVEDAAPVALPDGLDGRTREALIAAHRALSDFLTGESATTPVAASAPVAAPVAAGEPVQLAFQLDPWRKGMPGYRRTWKTVRADLAAAGVQATVGALDAERRFTVTVSADAANTARNVVAAALACQMAVTA